jgi:hypothetical protein
VLVRVATPGDSASSFAGSPSTASDGDAAAVEASPRGDDAAGKAGVP